MKKSLPVDRQAAFHAGSVLSGSANGAVVSASAAIDALFRIDFVFSVAFSDRGNGAAFSAGAAGNAIIRNLVCHN